jgi:hypothetical protein
MDVANVSNALAMRSVSETRSFPATETEFDKLSRLFNAFGCFATYGSLHIGPLDIHCVLCYGIATDSTTLTTKLVLIHIRSTSSYNALNLFYSLPKRLPFLVVASGGVSRNVYPSFAKEHILPLTEVGGTSRRCKLGLLCILGGTTRRPFCFLGRLGCCCRRNWGRSSTHGEEEIEEM